MSNCIKNSNLAEVSVGLQIDIKRLFGVDADNLELYGFNTAERIIDYVRENSSEYLFIELEDFLLESWSE